MQEEDKDEDKEEDDDGRASSSILSTPIPQSLQNSGSAFPGTGN